MCHVDEQTISDLKPPFILFSSTSEEKQNYIFQIIFDYNSSKLIVSSCNQRRMF